MSYNFVDVKKADQENSKNNGKVRQRKRCLPWWKWIRSFLPYLIELCTLWIEHMCSLEFELHDVYTKIDLDAQLYNQCTHIGEYQ